MPFLPAGCSCAVALPTVPPLAAFCVENPDPDPVLAVVLQG